MIIKSLQESNITINFYGKGSFCHKTRQVNPEAVKEKNVLFLKQTHSNQVIVINDNQRTSEVEGDALVTNQPLALAVISADCVPILLADIEAQIIAAVHVGWRGANADIIKASVEKMKVLGADVSHIKAFIGPCIRIESYEVSNDFVKEFTDTNNNCELFFPKIKGKHYFNLPEYCKYKLEKAGAHKIYDSLHDTYSNPEVLHSYRYGCHNSIEAGRQISVISINV